MILCTIVFCRTFKNDLQLLLSLSEVLSSDILEIMSPQHEYIILQ